MESRAAAATLSPMEFSKPATIGTLIVVVSSIAAFLLLHRPAQTTLEFDNRPDHIAKFAESGPTRLLLRMTRGQQADIVSVTAEPENSVNILAQPGACAPARSLTLDVPVCALWIERGAAAEKQARVRIAYRSRGESNTSEVVLRVR